MSETGKHELSRQERASGPDPLAWDQFFTMLREAGIDYSDYMLDRPLNITRPDRGLFDDVLGEDNSGSGNLNPSQEQKIPGSRKD